MATTANTPAASAGGRPTDSTCHQAAGGTHLATCWWNFLRDIPEQPLPFPPPCPPHLGTSGQCTLVGAGRDPGSHPQSPQAIQAATVLLLVDDLVSDAIVAHASPAGARIVYGQARRLQSTPLGLHRKLMLMAVNEGENVVRLRGRPVHPAVKEEVEHLRGRRSSDSAITASRRPGRASSLGAPLTHREHTTAWCLSQPYQARRHRH